MTGRDQDTGDDEAPAEPAAATPPSSNEAPSPASPPASESDPGSGSASAEADSGPSAPSAAEVATSHEAPEAAAGAEAPATKGRKPRRGRGRRKGAGRGRKDEGAGEAPAEETPSAPRGGRARSPEGRSERRIGSPEAEHAHALRELEDICERAADVARRLFLAKPYSRDVTKGLPDCELDLRVDFRGRPAETRAQAKELLERLEGHIDDAILHLAAFRPGAVYSFFDESSEGSQCRPVDPREIFCGYGETGLPQWQPMLSWAVDTGFDRVEDLVKERGEPVVAVMDRDQLVGKRLESFTNTERAYDLRGQVAIGYYGDGDDPARRFAVTMQILISHTRSRSVRLGLNVLGRLPDGGDAHDLLGSSAPWSYIELHRQAQRRLAAVNQELKRKPAGERRAFAEEESRRLLADLAQAGAQRARRANWRTGHARERARDKSRPTGLARNDVDAARPERVYRDAQDSTVIVLGPRGRVHVFTPEGLHVTSLHLDRAALDQRTQRRRWQPMAAEDTHVALAAIRARFAPTD